LISKGVCLILAALGLSFRNPSVKISENQCVVTDKLSEQKKIRSKQKNVNQRYRRESQTKLFSIGMAKNDKIQYYGKMFSYGQQKVFCDKSEVINNSKNKETYTKSRFFFLVFHCECYLP